jgi:hypothetical protein
MGDRIQQRLDDDVADMPLFHGNNKDTIKASTFIDRIQQGIDSLNWTPAQAFSYFRNALRSDADDWLHTQMHMFPDVAETWTVYKPFFCEKYGVATIQHTFFHKVHTLSLASCDNKLDKYYRHISDTMNGAKEAFLRPVITFPVNDDLWDDDAVVRAGHTAYVTAALLGNTNRIFAYLEAEAYINGLPQHMYDKIKNKVAIITSAQMHQYLVKD